MHLRLGGQRPTYERIGEYVSTRGPEAVEMFEAYGRRYYDSQKYEMGLFFARSDGGGFAAKTLCITKPRQNGKSFALRDYAIWMAAVEGKSVLYTAHHGRTSRKMFKEMCDFIEGHEDFREELDYIYKAGGYEGIYFRSGSCIEFQTRTNSGGRGGTYQIIVFDEAQELTSAQQDAILPTVSAGGEIENGDGDPQKIYVGTVPGPECAGTVFRTLHDRAHSGESSVWWLEWGAQGEGLDEVDVDNVDLWYACNPAMGRRMSEDTVRDEHDTMSRDGFARERLGWWSPTAGVISYLIPQPIWERATRQSPPNTYDKLAYGVRFTPDGRSVALATAVIHQDGCHVEFVRSEPTVVGVGWLVDWLIARKGKAAAVGIDGRADATDLGQQLISAGMPKQAVMVARTSDAIAADAMLVNAINDGNLTHLDDPALAESALGATRRVIGKDGGYGFGGECPERLDACALALWAARTTKRDPRRKGRIG